MRGAGGEVNEQTPKLLEIEFYLKLKNLNASHPSHSGEGTGVRSMNTGEGTG